MTPLAKHHQDSCCSNCILSLFLTAITGHITTVFQQDYEKNLKRQRKQSYVVSWAYDLQSVKYAQN